MKKDINNNKYNNLKFTDILAVDRTILANERTFLAYIRTSLNVLAAGISFIKLFKFLPIQILGYILVPLGLIIFIIGLYRFLKINKNIHKND
ncbi:DUF202 domain-containing protein [Clostridium sp. D2Q-11]|uniref:DUF202 domain-containing protein n=1 Tax=Anaeromonas frigoriresistens TaxID=2683708 RepID=A0A942UT58_9FIRM|nr:DUF202 domain-containing protein [Anaeromonas frigoriresistens]MBS4538754.1 DUF202 domain-containing protein [Anaeromonas frigoriresistens]